MLLVGNMASNTGHLGLNLFEKKLKKKVKVVFYAFHICKLYFSVHEGNSSIEYEFIQCHAMIQLVLAV